MDGSMVVAVLLIKSRANWNANGFSIFLESSRLDKMISKRSAGTASFSLISGHMTSSMKVRTLGVWFWLYVETKYQC